MRRLVWSVVAAAAVSSFAVSPLQTPALASGSPFAKAVDKRKTIEPVRARPVRISDNFGKAGLNLRGFPDAGPRIRNFRLPADARPVDFGRVRTTSNSAFSRKPRSTQQLSNALRTFRNDKKVAPFSSRFSTGNRTERGSTIRVSR